MENVVLFSGRHGGWSFARKLSVPSGGLLPFLSTLSSVIDQRGDHYLAGFFDLSGLHSSLDDVIRSRSDLDRAVSSALRGRAVQSKVSDILSAVSSEYSLDKKQAAAMKDILRVYCVRYVLSAKMGDFEHVLDAGERIEPMGEGYFFVANADGWVAVKKQKITEKTTPVDLLFYVASLSSTLHSKAGELLPVEESADRIRPSGACALALKLSDGGKNVSVYDLALKKYMALAGAPVHYGVAYDRVRPPRRIRGVKTK